MVQIKNRSTNNCLYTIPELNIRRDFRPGEIMEIEEKEIQQLLYQPGAEELLADNFIIGNKELAEKYFTAAAEPEYWMQETDIEDLIKTGSTDELLDFLDFAPLGAIDLLKQYSITLPMTDMNKISILKDKLSFDVNKILALYADSVTQPSAQSGKQRRVRK